MPEALAGPLALGVLGLIAGSFLATSVIRWPEGRSVARGRSACDACGRTLRAGELVPLLSALASRGRCRGCGARIDALHWHIEAMCGVVGALSGWVAPGLEGAAGALFGWLLVALAALDVAERWLPDALTAPLAVAGVGAGLLRFEPPLVDRLMGGLTGYLLLAAVAFGYRRWRGREGLGGGDPKLLGAIGLWLGWRMLPFVLLLASAAGLAAVLAARVAGRDIARDTPVPFGALLAAAAYPLWLVVVSTGA